MSTIYIQTWTYIIFFAWIIYRVSTDSALKISILWLDDTQSYTASSFYKEIKMSKDVWPIFKQMHQSIYDEKKKDPNGPTPKIQELFTVFMLFADQKMHLKWQFLAVWSYYDVTRIIMLINGLWKSNLFYYLIVFLDLSDFNSLVKLERSNFISTFYFIFIFLCFCK